MQNYKDTFFLVWAPHFTSAYGKGGRRAGSILLTLRYWHYNDVGLAPNVITCYDMLLAINKFKNRYFWKFWQFFQKVEWKFLRFQKFWIWRFWDPFLGNWYLIMIFRQFLDSVIISEYNRLKYSSGIPIWLQTSVNYFSIWLHFSFFEGIWLSLHMVWGRRTSRKFIHKKAFRKFIRFWKKFYSKMFDSKLLATNIVLIYN